MFTSEDNITDHMKRYHESKPDQPDLGQVMVGRLEETGKADQLRRNIYKVGLSLSLWS